MAETVGTLITALGRRIRDPNNLAHSATNVTTLLSAVQQVVNTMTGAVKTSVTTGITTNPAFGLLSTVNNGLVRVERLLYRGQDVIRAPWPRFAAVDPLWARRSGSRPLMWDMVGRTTLAVTPCIPSTAETVTLIGTKTLTTLTTSGQATEVSDQLMPVILSMAEQLLLQRQRLMASIKPSVEHFEKALKAGIP